MPYTVQTPVRLHSFRHQLNLSTSCSDCLQEVYYTRANRPEQCKLILCIYHGEDKRLLLLGKLMEGQSRKAPILRVHSSQDRMSCAKNSQSFQRAPKRLSPNSAPAELCDTYRRWRGSILFPLSQFTRAFENLNVLYSTSSVFMDAIQLKLQFRLGTQAATLTLGKVSCPTRSCTCLMVLKAKVLTAKGSHRIIDKSLRRSKNQIRVMQNKEPNHTVPYPAVDTSSLNVCFTKLRYLSPLFVAILSTIRCYIKVVCVCV